MIYPDNKPLISSDIVCLINMIFFALTNGLLTSVNMALAPQNVQEEEKETTGFIMNFPLTFGIFMGTVLAVSLRNI